MASYERKDIKIIDDAIAIIQSRPEMYLGGAASPTGAGLAEAVMRDITALDALPAKVERENGWWLISSEKDWLATVDGKTPTSLFFQIIPFPALGPNSHRSECPVGAFADAVVIAAQNEAIWIKGDRSRHILPSSVTAQRSPSEQGRILAFVLDDETHPFASMTVWLGLRTNGAT